MEGWNNTAIDCYKRGCICEGCDLEEFCTGLVFLHKIRIKPMKKTVIELVKKYGVPK